MVVVSASDASTAKSLNSLIKNANHAFILIYMVGCGPCKATKPEWEKMADKLKNEYDDDIAIIDLDSNFMDEVDGIGEVSGFPCIKYINTDKGIVEQYEDSKIPTTKARSAESFIEWIKSKISPTKTGGGSVRDLLKGIEKSIKSIKISKKSWKTRKTRKNKGRKGRKNGRSGKTRRSKKTRKRN